jgi:ATP-binding cassette subfamily A (ABC1) protein 3
LLGLNGAGKTTTFKILIGEIEPTSGQAFVNGFDIKKNKYEARRNLGFCPQFDILPEYLTVKETFKLIAGLRGLERKTVDKTITELIQVFKLNEFNDKLVQDLSGGNKRKVSAGIAFLGRPSVVILVKYFFLTFFLFAFILTQLYLMF